MTFPDDVRTTTVELPEELLRRCRADESGVQLTDRAHPRKASAFGTTQPDATKPAPVTNAVPTSEVDALGYDPFEDQPTLIHEPSWRASVKPPVDFPLPLHRKKPHWLESLPPAALEVLLAAAEPVAADAKRLVGAIAQPVVATQELANEQEVGNEPPVVRGLCKSSLTNNKG